MISLYSYLTDDWVSLAETDPQAFIQEVENRCIIEGDFRKYIQLLEHGSKVTKETASKRGNMAVGDWIVRPYFERGIQLIKRNVLNGRIPIRSEA